MDLPDTCRAPGDEDEINTVAELMQHISHRHTAGGEYKVTRVTDRGDLDWLVIELNCPTFGGQYWFWGDGTVMQVL